MKKIILITIVIFLPIIVKCQTIAEQRKAWGEKIEKRKLISMAACDTIYNKYRNDISFIDKETVFRKEIKKTLEKFQTQYAGTSTQSPEAIADLYIEALKNNNYSDILKYSVVDYDTNIEEKILSELDNTIYKELKINNKDLDTNLIICKYFSFRNGSIDKLIEAKGRYFSILDNNSDIKSKKNYRTSYKYIYNQRPEWKPFLNPKDSIISTTKITFYLNEFDENKSKGITIKKTASPTITKTYYGSNYCILDDYISQDCVNSAYNKMRDVILIKINGVWKVLHTRG